jgi:hypothetical protein
LVTASMAARFSATKRVERPRAESVAIDDVTL